MYDHFILILQYLLFIMCSFNLIFFCTKRREIRSQENVSILCSFKYFWNATPFIPRILLTLNWLAEPANRTSYLSTMTYPSIILLKTCLSQKLRRMSHLEGIRRLNLWEERRKQSKGTLSEDEHSKGNVAFNSLQKIWTNYDILVSRDFKKTTTATATGT